MAFSLLDENSWKNSAAPDDFKKILLCKQWLVLIKKIPMSAETL
jgi:hypothetical protein